MHSSIYKEGPSDGLSTDMEDGTTCHMREGGSAGWYGVGVRHRRNAVASFPACDGQEGHASLRLYACPPCMILCSDVGVRLCRLGLCLSMDLQWITVDATLHTRVVPLHRLALCKLSRPFLRCTVAAAVHVVLQAPFCTG